MGVPRRDYTENYDLDLYMPCDRPNLRDQYNTAMHKIDCAMKGLHDRDVLLSTDLAASNSMARQAYDQAVANESLLDKHDGILKEHDARIDGKAPIFHASTTREFGPATNTHYGHVMLSDDYMSDANIGSGTAVTPHALHLMYMNLQQQYTELNSLYATLIARINAPAINILQYNAANEGYYNPTNCTCYYRHGIVVLDFIDAPLPEERMLGGDGIDDYSCLVGTIPKQYCPKQNQASAGAAFRSTNFEIWPSDKEQGDKQMTNTGILKIWNNGNVIINFEKVANSQWGKVENHGSIQGNLVYPVIDAEILTLGTFV